MDAVWVVCPAVPPSLYAVLNEQVRSRLPQHPDPHDSALPQPPASFLHAVMLDRCPAAHARGMACPPAVAQRLCDHAPDPHPPSPACLENLQGIADAAANDTLTPIPMMEVNTTEASHPWCYSLWRVVMTARMCMPSVLAEAR
jgi:hypothetical protein